MAAFRLMHVDSSSSYDTFERSSDSRAPSQKRLFFDELSMEPLAVFYRQNYLGVDAPVMPKMGVIEQDEYVFDLRKARTESVLKELKRLMFIIDGEAEVLDHILSAFQAPQKIVDVVNEVALRFENYKKTIFVWQSQEDSEDTHLQIKIWSMTWADKDYQKIEEIYQTPAMLRLSSLREWIQVSLDYETL